MSLRFSATVRRGSARLGGTSGGLREQQSGPRSLVLLPFRPPRCLTQRQQYIARESLQSSSQRFSALAERGPASDPVLSSPAFNALPKRPTHSRSILLRPKPWSMRVKALRGPADRLQTARAVNALPKTPSGKFLRTDRELISVPLRLKRTLIASRLSRCRPSYSPRVLRGRVHGRRVFEFHQTYFTCV
jgi:hypothetical protein